MNRSHACSMEARLPGGLLKNGAVERRVRFSQITGKAELKLAELDRTDELSFVSSLLGMLVESVGDTAFDENVANLLCMADRQFLMLRLAALLEGEQAWLKVYCSQCDAPFDVEIRRCDLPVKQAGEGFPSTAIHLSSGPALVRIPTAADQMSIRHLSEKDAIRALAMRCLSANDDDTPDGVRFDSLSETDIDSIDDVLDELSPAVCRELLVVCPECHAEQRAELNHYRLPGMNASLLFNEVHALAMHYHWSEADILSLPRERRSRYLMLIDRSRAMLGDGV